jgi:hypothetical protein
MCKIIENQFSALAALQTVFAAMRPDLSLLMA